MADDRNQDQGQGRGWHSDPEGHAKAGKKGGEATSKSHGEQFYQQIGIKGGNKVKELINEGKKIREQEDRQKLLDDSLKNLEKIENAE